MQLKNWKILKIGLKPYTDIHLSTARGRSRTNFDLEYPRIFRNRYLDTQISENSVSGIFDVQTYSSYYNRFDSMVIQIMSGKRGYTKLMTEWRFHFSDTESAQPRKDRITLISQPSALVRSIRNPGISTQGIFLSWKVKIWKSSRTRESLDMDRIYPG